MSRDYAAVAAEYARDVIAGRILACRFVQQACERHLSDLARAESGELDFWFDEAAARRVCRFVELLPHTKGRWALGVPGRPRSNLIRLEPWQCFILSSVFGWLRPDGTRRFRIIYIEVPRKNGKSLLAAGVGLYMFAADGEYGAEVYSGATSEKQAWEVFRPAKLMAERTPEFLSHYNVAANASNLHIVVTGSRFEPVIGKPGDGASPSCAIVDEFHEHQTDELYDTMLTGMGARDQPLMFVITTAGSDTSGPCYALRSELVQTLTGAAVNDELFGAIYTIDEGDDWTSEIALEKANPNFGVSVGADFLGSRQQEAIQSARRQSTFKTKHLNLWVTAASPYFNLERWARLADPSLSEDQFAGEACWMGMDLASKLDIAAVVKLFRRELDGVDHYYAFCRSYLPRSRASDPALRRYGQWATEGHLTIAGETITDYDTIEEDILDDADLFRIVQLGFDPYNATQLVGRLMADGVECVEVPQTVLHLSEPMKWVQALIEDGRIHHSGDPVFSWALGNVTAQEDRKENVFPRKERPENKIDPATALIIAMGRALSEQESEDSSRYESEGIRST